MCSKKRTDGQRNKITRTQCWSTELDIVKAGSVYGAWLGLWKMDGKGPETMMNKC